MIWQPEWPAADDEDCAVRETFGSAVLACRQLELDRRRLDPVHARTWLLKRPGRDHDVGRSQSLVRLEDEPLGLAAKPATSTRSRMGAPNERE